jgi:hypothetical protein
VQYSSVLEPVHLAQAECKPCLTSFDSGQEFSLEHLAEVCKMVEIAAIDHRELKGYVFDDSCLRVSE